MKKFHWPAMSAVAILGSLSACDGDGQASSAASLVNVEVEAAGHNCESGGQRIETGVDQNRDGMLSSEEVTNTSFACNGAKGGSGKDGDSGQTSLVDVQDEPAGKNCPTGGQKVSTGLDANADGALDSDEVQNVFYLCQGRAGYNSVFATVTEPAGENCATGGQKLAHGMDLDGNGALDADEVEGEAFICNGAVGATGSVSLAVASEEAAGQHCAAGGQRIDTGVDANANESLDAEEIAQTTYVCNGVDGAASLVLVTDEAAGSNCAAGGQRIDQGIDDNANHTLDAAEIDSTRYVCNGTDGTDGISTLMLASTIPMGAVCTNGGQSLSIGLDNGDGNGIARNGTLEAGEVDSTANLCNGVNGKDGVDGKDAAGGVHLIDANGFDLGRMAGGSGGFISNMTMLSNTGYAYSLYYYNLTYYPNTIYYTNNDCTGTAFTYSPLQGSQNTIGGHFAAYVDTVGWFGAIPNSYAATRNFASYRSNASCYANSGTTGGFTVEATTAAVVGVPTTAPATPATLQ